MEVERLWNVSDSGSGSGSGSSVAGFASCQRPSLRSSSGTVAVVMVASPAPTGNANDAAVGEEDRQDWNAR